MVLNYDLGKAKSKILVYFLCVFATLREKKKKHKEHQANTKFTKLKIYKKIISEIRLNP